MTNRMTVMFNEEELSKYLYVTDGLNRGIIGDRTNTTVKVGRSNGEHFLDTTLGMRKIVVPFYMDKNDKKAIEEIVRILNVDEPKRLIFGDEPDWYYNAIPDGEISFTQLEKEGSGTITFVAPDMYKYSTTTKTFNNKTGNKNEILFDNNSNATALINVEVKAKGDNGFVGLAMNGNVVQVGKPTQVDGEIFDDAEVLIHGDPQLEPNKDGEINKVGFETVPNAYQWLPRKQGKMSLHYYENEGTLDPHLQVDDFGTRPEVRWPVECTVTYKLPTDKTTNTEGAKGFTFRWHLDFNDAPNPSSSGQIVATVHHKDGKALCSMLLQDLYVGKLDYLIEGHVNGKKVYSYAPDVFKYTNVGNHMAIIKMGSKFTFKDSWNSHTVDIAGTENEEGFYVSFSFLKWFPYETPYVYGIFSWNFQENYVQLWHDNPNYFMKGDVLTVNSEKNEVLINGRKDWDNTDIGSKPLIAEIGKNALGIVVSDWIDEAHFPDVTIYFQERKI